MSHDLQHCRSLLKFVIFLSQVHGDILEPRFYLGPCSSLMNLAFDLFHEAMTLGRS